MSEPQVNPTKQLRGRRKLFIQYYSNRGVETYHNATKSAIKAGYTTNGAGVIGCNLLKDINIASAIAAKEAEQDQALEITKEQAIKETRINYETATTTQAKKYWYEIWLKLKGWDIQRQEVTTRDAPTDLVDQIEAYLKAKA